MKLVGVYISPFVRRVAIALHVLQLPFEQVAASVVDGRGVIATFNGLVRVPALVLDDGDVLVDSHKILHELDRLVGVERALGPRDAATARPFGQMIAFATGALEKNVAAFYEQVRRPADKVWPVWAEQCVAQAIGGLASAEALADPSVLAGGFLFEGRLTHADIAAALAFESIGPRLPEGEAASRFPKLAALAGRLLETEPFALTSPRSPA